MAPLKSFLAVASLVSLVAAVPSPNVDISGGTTVQQVRKPGYVRNGPLALYKIYLKYNLTPPEDLVNYVKNFGGFSKRSEGSVTASPINSVDSEYTIPVSIGTPAQVLQMDVDTGSSDLWVFSSETESDEVDGQTLYDPSQSSTSKKLSGYTYSVQYGDGSSSSGEIYTDKVKIAGITVTKQAVEVAQQVSSSFTSDSSSDGLVGLAFDSLNTASPSSVQTFFGNAQSKLDSPLFTADLKHDAGKRNAPPKNDLYKICEILALTYLQLARTALASSIHLYTRAASLMKTLTARTVSGAGLPAATPLVRAALCRPKSLVLLTPAPH